MARISQQLPDFDITCDVENNPEIILMMAEDDEDVDSTVSLWLAGQAITKPRNSHYDDTH